MCIKEANFGCQFTCQIIRVTKLFDDPLLISMEQLMEMREQGKNT